MLDLGAVGSPLDAATFVLVLVSLRYRYEPQFRTLAAAVVALARGYRVNADRLQSDLDVEERDVQGARIVACGGTEVGEGAA